MRVQNKKHTLPPMGVLWSSAVFYVSACWSVRGCSVKQVALSGWISKDLLPELVQLMNMSGRKVTHAEGRQQGSATGVRTMPMALCYTMQISFNLKQTRKVLAFIYLYFKTM